MQGVGPYSQKIKQVEEDISGIMKKVNDLTGYCQSTCVVDRSV